MRSIGRFRTSKLSGCWFPSESGDGNPSATKIKSAASISVDGDRMRRRDVIGLLGSTAITWPLAARAQERADRVPRIGVLMAVAEADPEGQARGRALRRGLRELGWN